MPHNRNRISSEHALTSSKCQGTNVAGVSHYTLGLSLRHASTAGERKNTSCKRALNPGCNMIINRPAPAFCSTAVYTLVANNLGRFDPDIPQISIKKVVKIKCQLT